MNVVALAGGVGAAKFLRGLVAVIPPEQVTVIVNTGDDAVIHGLHVSPDLDIVTYTLAGVVDPRGWGFEHDTTRALDQMAAYGAPSWFTLGDRDIGTHLARTAWLAEGLTLSRITDRIRRALGVSSRIIPMSDQPVATKLETDAGQTLGFQEYFVKLGHSVAVREIFFEGALEAAAAPGVLDALAAADRIVICPSNPLLSIEPIFAVPGIKQAVAARRPDVLAISPIVAGAALKGPADKLLPLRGAEATAAGVASLYADVCARFVLDRRDAGHAARVSSLGMTPLVADIVMQNEGVARRLARAVLQPQSVPAP